VNVSIYLGMYQSWVDTVTLLELGMKNCGLITLDLSFPDVSLNSSYTFKQMTRSY